MQFPKLLSFSNALNGMKRRQDGYNLETTGMLPNFGKTVTPPAASAQPTNSVSRASAVLDLVFAGLKKTAAAAKRVLLKPEEPQPFAAPKDQKSYQIFRRLPEHDARHVVPAANGESTAGALTDNQELGQSIKPTLLEKLSFKQNRSFEPVAPVSDTTPQIVDAHCSERPAFSATCPGKPEANLIADAYEKRMAEKKPSLVVPASAGQVSGHQKAEIQTQTAAPVVNSAAKPEVKQSVSAKLRESIFGRSKKNAVQPAVQGEFALENVRPIRNDLSDADLEVVSVEAKVGTGNLQTATTEKAQSTATSRRAPKKTDIAINSDAATPPAEPTPELIARV